MCPGALIMGSDLSRILLRCVHFAPKLRIREKGFCGHQTSELIIRTKNEEGYAQCLLWWLETQEEEEKKTYWQLVCDLPNHLHHRKGFKKVLHFFNVVTHTIELIILFPVSPCFLWGTTDQGLIMNQLQSACCWRSGEVSSAVVVRPLNVLLGYAWGKCWLLEEPLEWARDDVLNWGFLENSNLSPFPKTAMLFLVDY